MPHKRRLDEGHALAGGIVAGVLGGIVLAAISIVEARAGGRDVWQALKGAALPFAHERAQLPGFDASIVALGVVLHFAVSIAWGIVFGALCYGLSRPATVVAGALWGVVVWFGMYFVVLPLVGLPQVAQAAPFARVFVAHLAFGLALGAGFLPFQHKKPTAPPLARAPVPP